MDAEKLRLPLVIADAPDVCRRLRSKGTPGVPYDDAVTWQVGSNMSAVFWCLGTADVAGPDDGFVHPHVCVRGRECFAAP
jgi:hypothetical protein